MAAWETRLLLLGAVSLFEPVNGYQLRRELLSWEVQSWANVQPGSIYNGLATLARRGELVRHDLRDGGRDVAVYEVSDQGRARFARLMETAMTTVTPTAPIAFHTAMAMLPLVTRADALRLLRLRLDRLAEVVQTYAVAAADAGRMPPHVVALADFWERLVKVEWEWITRLVAQIADGRLAFVGEADAWTPAHDDPGWQMHADRQRYLTLLGQI